MNLIAKSKYYILYNTININIKIFNNIKLLIPNTFFSIIDFKFFKILLKKKIILLFLIKNKKKTASIFTIIQPNQINILKKEILFFFLKNPFKLFINIILILKSLNRGENKFFNNVDYLHLLHFIIFKKGFNNLSLKEKDRLFNFFFKKIIKIYNAKYFFLCYEDENIKAKNFYLRNNFICYQKKNNLVFLKKKFD